MTLGTDHRKKRPGHLFGVNGILSMTQNAALLLRQFDPGTGGPYPLELVRYDGLTPVDGVFRALHFGAKRNALAMKESRAVDEPNWRGNCRPKPWIKDDDLAVTRAVVGGR